MVTARRWLRVTGTSGSAPPVTVRLAHDLIGGGNRIGAEFAERHIHHPAGFLGALDVGEIVIVVLGIAQSVENQDEALIAALGRDGDAITGRVGVAGLKPIRARQRAQHQVAVGLGDVVPDEALLAEIMIIFADSR